MKKSKKIAIVIACIVVVLLAIGIVLIHGFEEKEDNSNKNSSPSIFESKTSYEIVLKDNDDIEISAVPYNNETELAVFGTSLGNYVDLGIEITMYDENDQVLSTKVEKYTLVSKNDQFVFSTVVDSTLVKKIEIGSVPGDKADVNKVIMLDKKKLNFNVTDSIDSDNNVIMLKLAIDNPYTQAISLINGYVVLYNNGDLVDTVPFSAINIDQDSQFLTTVSANLINTVGLINYDEVKVIVNELF